MPPPKRPERIPPRPLSELARFLGCEPAGADPESPPVTVTGLTHDSRTVRPGDVYAALPGDRAHGAEFAAQAAQAGAVALLTDPEGRSRAESTGLPLLVLPEPRAHLGEAAAWIYGHPADELLMLGTTGTSGKTTVSYLMESGLRAAGSRTGLVGTVETKIGDEQVASELTTPESTDLHGLLAVMREQGVDAVAMEVSSHALAMGRVGGVTYDVAVFTNLSQDHLDFHADMRDYFETKARLFTPELARVAVVNIDDPFGRALVDMVTARGEVPVTTFSAGGDPAADWHATDVALGREGAEFRVVGPGGVEAEAAVRLPGGFNVANALAAAVGLVEAGVPLRAALDGVAAARGVPGRLEPVDEGQEFTALVDYSHKPGAIEAVLTAMRKITENEVSIVFGCGGDRDRAKRPLMGEAAARLADSVIITDDNPRSEDPMAIISAVLEGVEKVPVEQRARITVEPDRAGAIAMAVARARAGDVVVIAGKGHERGQYVAGAVLPFDDREVLREALRSSGS